MGAYAALLSLTHTLDQIFVLDQYPLPLEKEKLVSLHENVTALMKFLEDYSCKYRGVANPEENRIISAAYQAEVIIDSQLASQQPQSAFKNMMQLFQSSGSSLEVKREDLRKALKKFNSIYKKAINHKVENTPPPDFSDHSASSSTIAPTDPDITVGLDADFQAIKELMYRDSSTLQVIPIFGMGGIGKTTLATRLYEDSVKMQLFDRRIWLVVSQDFSLRKILLGILQSIKMPTDEKLTDGNLKTRVHQELFGRRYLIVADDVCGLWSEEAWDILYRVLPKDSRRSKVLWTTRLQNVAAYAGSPSTLPHEIRFLSEDQSWRLLEERVFGQVSSPSQMELIGKEIAKCCLGLPLVIVVVAGLLKEELTEAHWRRTLH